MTYYGEEYIWQREEELLDFLRTDLSDPRTKRGIEQEDSFPATGGINEDFTLTKTLIKNVKSITVNGSPIKRGRDYLVLYGEDGETAPYNKTIVTIRSVTVDDGVVITYHYGDCYIHEGFGVDGKQLPLCFLQQLSNDSEPIGIGEGFGDGKSQIVNGSYNFEVRDKFQRRCKKKAHQAFNLVSQFRHTNPFRLRTITAGNLANLDYDVEKRAYVFQFTIRVQWEVPFE